MEYTIPYSWYYHPNFIDPLYAQYLVHIPKSLNPYLVNKNEIRDGCKGIYFRKKYSEFPCPPGYSCYNLDYCYKSPGKVIGLYNCPHKKEYWQEPNISIELFK